MTEIARFGELEEKVRDIVKRYGDTKREHDKTLAELAEAKYKIAVLEKEIGESVDKKKEALDRVDELIKLLESVPR